MKSPLINAERHAPFFFAGDSYAHHGCLLLHGFSGTPAEMRGLGEYLAAQGYRVWGVRLAGHGDTPEALRRVGWRDWLRSAETGFAELRRQCAHVTVIGFSLGGALSLMLAQRRHIEQLVLLATPLGLQGDWRLRLLPVAHLVIPWFYPLEKADFNDPLIQQRVREYAPDVDLHDPQVVAHIRRTVRIPVRAINELQTALQVARSIPPQITTPTLIMHGRNDQIAAPAYATELYTRLASPQRELVWWDDTEHQLLEVGPHRQAIYARIGEFIQVTLNDFQHAA